MHERIIGYVFDMDGTLLDTSSSVPQAFIECVVSLGGRRHSSEGLIAAYDLGPPNVTLSHLLGRPCTSNDIDTHYRYLRAHRSDAIDH